MVKFITLTGELTGSARLNMQNSRPELYLRLRTRRNGRLRAFVTDGSKVREVTLSGNSGAFESISVRGLILTDEYGNILSTGSGDMCAKELESFKIGIRMLISAKDDAEKYHTFHTAQTPNQRDNNKRSTGSDLPDSYTSNQKDNALARRVQPSAKTNQLPNVSSEKSFEQNTEGKAKQNASCPANPEKAQVQTAGGRRNKNQNTSILHSIEGRPNPETQSPIKPTAKASSAQHDIRQSMQNTDRQSQAKPTAKASAAQNDAGQSKQSTEGQSQIKPYARASSAQHDAGQSMQSTDGQSTIKPTARVSSIQQDIRQSNQNASCTAHSEKAQGKTTGIRGNKKQNTSIMRSNEGRLTPEAPEKPQSPATLEILNQAGYLFHGERVKNSEQQFRQKRNNTEINDMSDSAFMGYEVNQSECNNCKNETLPPMREAVRNPFPNFFDNSYWWRNEGDTKRIYGIANVRGVKYNVTAVRSNAKYPPNGIGRSVRRMYSSEGKRFWVGLTKV